MKYTIILVLFAINVSFGQTANDWTTLLGGSDFNGWNQKNGKADYVIKDGVITGTTVMNTPNSFMCSDKIYGDFILEFEVKVHPDLNSGVQIRSQSLPDYNNGRVHGYQIEIDPSPRAFTGGIYDEGRRGWMYPLANNKKGRAAFKNGEWNHIRVEAIGSTIKTWVNHQQCAHLVDDMTSEGFIGLQVHSIGQEDEAGKTIQWRNIRIQEDPNSENCWSDDPSVQQVSFLVNQLTSWEERKGWRLLWNGVNGEGWRGAKRTDFPDYGWTVSDGVLTIEGSDGAESAGPGDIVTEDLFSDFILDLEFKITSGANSGIKYFVDAALNKGEGSAIGCEFQILDDKEHPDASQGVNGNRTVGSLYDLITAKNAIPNRSKQFKGVDRWNKARIVSNHGKVQHWLNGELIVEYDRFSQMFEALVAYSKYKVWPGFGQWPEGHILLQDHGNTVHFRSIKIKEL